MDQLLATTRYFIFLTTTTTTTALSIFGQPQMDSYKWKDIVNEQIPVIRTECLQHFNKCSNNSFTFDDLLYTHPDQRRKMCHMHKDNMTCLKRDETDNYNNGNDLITTTPSGNYGPPACFDREKTAIEKLLCYEFDTNNTETPPISSHCARRYAKCGQFQEPLLDFVRNMNHSWMCQDLERCREYLDTRGDYGYSIYCEEFTILYLIKFFCQRNRHSFSGKINLPPQCVSAVLNCFSANYNVFPALTYMKNLNHQHYACGLQYECLVSEGLCSHLEAEVMDNFMCTNTTFVPDIYNLFLLTDQCKNVFQSEFLNYSLTQLQLQDEQEKKFLCGYKTYANYDKFKFKTYCEIDERILIGNFLCFSQDNVILRVSKECTIAFLNCYSAASEFSDLLNTGRYNRPAFNWCSSERSTPCYTDVREACSNTEFRYITEFVCSTPDLRSRGTTILMHNHNICLIVTNIILVSWKWNSFP